MHACHSHRRKPVLRQRGAARLSLVCWWPHFCSFSLWGTAAPLIHPLTSVLPTGVTPLQDQGRWWHTRPQTPWSTTTCSCVTPYCHCHLFATSAGPVNLSPFCCNPIVALQQSRFCSNALSSTSAAMLNRADFTAWFSLTETKNSLLSGTKCSSAGTPLHPRTKISGRADSSISKISFTTIKKHFLSLPRPNL